MQGQPVGSLCRSVGISEQSNNRWRREFGGLEVVQVRRLKDLERENARLKQTYVVSAVMVLNAAGQVFRRYVGAGDLLLLELLALIDWMLATKGPDAGNAAPALLLRPMT